MYSSVNTLPLSGSIAVLDGLKQAWHIVFGGKKGTAISGVACVYNGPVSLVCAQSAVLSACCLTPLEVRSHHRQCLHPHHQQLLPLLLLQGTSVLPSFSALAWLALERQRSCRYYQQ